MSASITLLYGPRSMDRSGAVGTVAVESSIHWQSLPGRVGERRCREGKLTLGLEIQSAMHSANNSRGRSTES
jgi:hypothetical protein